MRRLPRLPRSPPSSAQRHPPLLRLGGALDAPGARLHHPLHLPAQDESVEGGPDQPERTLEGELVGHQGPRRAVRPERVNVTEMAEQARALDVGEAVRTVKLGDPRRQGEAQPEEAGGPCRFIFQDGQARCAARRRLPLDRRRAGGVEVNAPGEVEATGGRRADHGLSA